MSAGRNRTPPLITDDRRKVVLGRRKGTVGAVFPLSIFFPPPLPIPLCDPALPSVQLIMVMASSGWGAPPALATDAGVADFLRLALLLICKAKQTGTGPICHDAARQMQSFPISRNQFISPKSPLHTHTHTHAAADTYTHKHTHTHKS